MALIKESPSEIAEEAAGLRNSLSARSGIFHYDFAVGDVMRVRGKSTILRLLKPLSTSNIALDINSALNRLTQSQREEFMYAWSQMFVGEFAPIIAHSAFSISSGNSKLNRTSHKWHTPSLLARSKFDSDSTNLMPIYREYAYPDAPKGLTEEETLYWIEKEDRKITLKIEEHFSSETGGEYFFDTPHGLSQLTPVWNIIHRYSSDRFLQPILGYGRLFNDSWDELVKSTKPSVKPVPDHIKRIERLYGV